MLTSDLSGKSIDPLAKAEVVVRLADGKERRLTVTASEADKLSSAGIELGNKWGRMRAALSRNWKQFAWWAFGLLVASLILPAATRQWSDRQAALTLKSSVVTDVSKSSVDVVFAAQRTQELPAGEEQEKARRAALDGWVRSEAEIDPVVATYFKGTRARDIWNAYRDTIFVYIALACCDQNRAEDVSTIQEFLGSPALRPPKPPPVENKDPWNILHNAPVDSTEFRDTYVWVGLELLSYRGLLLDELRRTPAVGYSVGIGDFWRDVIPGV